VGRRLARPASAKRGGPEQKPAAATQPDRLANTRRCYHGA